MIGLCSIGMMVSGVGFDAMMFLLCGKIPNQRSGTIPWQVQFPEGLNEKWLRQAFITGQFAFEDDDYRYDVIATRDRMLLHEIALRAALQYGVREYFDFFCDTKMNFSEFRELKKENVTGRDIEALNAFIASRHPEGR